jgi:response regulator RpfG family c-di-GMP phosphodiesterase
MRYSQEKTKGTDLPQPDSEHIVEIGRRMLDKTLRHQDTDLGVISRMLLKLNPENAESFMDDILGIDPHLPDQEKTKALEAILNRHSPHTLGHILMGRDLVKRLRDRKDIGILQSLRLDDLAKAIETHDFGKLGMRDSTLNSAHTQFSAQENREKEAHPLLGHILLKYLKFSDFSQRISLTHHLRYETVDGKLRIIGYPVADYLDYCKRNHLPFALRPEDHLAAYIDVYSALTDVHRVANLYGTNDSALSDIERARRAFEVMDRTYFKDDYYQKGMGAPLYRAFKKAMEETYGLTQRLAA